MRAASRTAPHGSDEGKVQASPAAAAPFAGAIGNRGKSKPIGAGRVSAIAAGTNLLALIPVAVIAALLGSGSVLADPSVFPTGTTRYDPERAYNSYVLFSGADEKTHLH
jgi:hypothetical protein